MLCRVTVEYSRTNLVELETATIMQLEFEHAEYLLARWTRIGKELTKLKAIAYLNTLREEWQ